MSIPNKVTVRKFIGVMSREGFAIMRYVQDNHESMNHDEIEGCWHRIVDLVQCMNAMAVPHLEDDDDVELWESTSRVMWEYAHEVKVYFE